MSPKIRPDLVLRWSESNFGPAGTRAVAARKPVARPAAYRAQPARDLNFPSCRKTWPLCRRFSPKSELHGADSGQTLGDASPLGLWAGRADPLAIEHSQDGSATSSCAEQHRCARAHLRTFVPFPPFPRRASQSAAPADASSV